MQTPDTWRTAQEPERESMLEVCCAMPHGTTVPQAEVMAATEAVSAMCSAVKHGKVMFDLHGQVLENPSHPFKSIRSLDIRQRDVCFQDEEISPRSHTVNRSGREETDDGSESVKRHAPHRCHKADSARASSVRHFEPPCDQKSDLPVKVCICTPDHLTSTSVILTCDTVSLSSFGTLHVRKRMTTRFECPSCRHPMPGASGQRLTCRTETWNMTSPESVWTNSSKEKIPPPIG